MRRTALKSLLILSSLFVMGCSVKTSNNNNNYYPGGGGGGGDIDTHTYDTKWSYDSNSHWHACLDSGYTNLRGDEAPHRFSETLDGNSIHRTCKVCNYTDTVSANPILSNQDLKLILPDGNSRSSNGYVMRSKSDIIYVDLAEIYNTMYYYFFGFNSSSFQLNCQQTSNNVYKLTCNIGYINVDVANDTMYFNEPRYMLVGQYRTNNDVAYLATGIETNYVSFNLNKTKDYATPKSVTFNFANYFIDLIGYNNRVYIPASTFIDIFANPNGVPLVFNGKNLYLGSYFGNSMFEINNDYENQYFNTSPWYRQANRTIQMADFNYYELCFALDNYYGLKDFRGISSFDSYFQNNNYKKKLLSKEAKTYEDSLVSFVGNWLYDGHAGFTKSDPATIGTSFSNTLAAGFRNNERYQTLASTQSELMGYRNNAGYGVGLRTYQDLAIVTFDQFMKYPYGDTQYINVDDYSYSYLHDYGTELLFRKAFMNITKNSSIKYVLFDLSLNGGGMVDALPWLFAYISDDPFMTYRNTLTGEISDNHYLVDLDYNGTKGDTYKNRYKFYLLTSNLSFSCGNAFPTFFKHGNMGKIIGEKSGGGACVVSSIATACGGLLRMSSVNQFGTYTNGTFTPNENGIAVDYSLPRNNFYNNQALRNAIISIG